MKITAILAAAFSLQFLAACETTGDPNKGGLFGWSESKAKDRIHSREAELDSVDRDTERVSGAAERRRRMLGE